MTPSHARRPSPQIAILAALTIASAAAAQVPLSGNVFNVGSNSPLTANGVYLVSSQVTVPSGSALTVPPGVVFKMGPGTTFNVQGTLIALGSSPQPIVFTSYRDDMFGGDTNNDGGATYPADGDWAYAYFGPNSDASSLTSTYFRFAGASTGYGPQPSVYFDGSNATWNVGTVENALAACATLQANSFPTISGVSFVGGTVAVENVPLGALAGFTSCGASGNSVYDAHRVTAANVTTPIAVAASNSLNGVGTFVLAANLSVSSTLTLDAGVVFKFEGNRTADVHQTLDVNGTAGSPVVFTSIKDDAFGGDTNQNGAANAGAPADWAYLAFQPNSDASTVDHLHVRFAGASTGYGPQPAVYAVSSNCALNGLVVQTSAGPCLDLQNNSYPTVQGCSFNGGTVAVQNAQLAALAGFSGCSAAGNSVYDAIRVTTATIGGAATVEVDDTLNGNGVFVVATNVTVLNGGTLTLDAGVTAKFEGNRLFEAYGVLLTNGGPGSPVTLTTTTDDAVGGDTNKNGAANVPTPASWAYLAMQSTSDASVLNGLHVRYAGASTGYGNQPSVYCAASNCTLSGCVVKHGAAAGLDLQTTSYPTVVGTAFENCTVAVQNAQLAALAGFSGCTASGNSVLNAIRVTAAHVTAPTSVVATNSLNNDGSFVLATNLTVSAPLTLGAGVVVKFEGSRTADFYQPLFANGADGAPVVFTTLADDAYGGDTDLDGAATPPVKGSWAYANFLAGSTPGALSYCRFRYAGASTGYGVQPSVYVAGSPTFAHCAFEHCAAACADLQSVGEPAMSFCAFDDGSAPLVGVRPTAVPKLFRCTAAGNASRQALRLAAPTVSGGQNLKWRKINSLNGDGALLLPSPLNVNAGGILTLGPGVVLKAEGNVQINAYGALVAAGSGAEPVVFTTLADDAFGGDSNADAGATAPVPGSWSYVYALAGSPSVFEHARVRFAGASTGYGVQPSVYAYSASAAWRSVRVEYGASSGFDFTAAAGPCDNLVAFANAFDGVRAASSPLTFRHLTSTANARYGVFRSGGFTTTVTNSIVRGNGSANFSGVNPPDVNYTCGLVGGGTGNFDADPLFVDAPLGDLRLQTASPCVDVAEPVTSFGIVKDHVENSRLCDGKLLGLPYPDLGAYEANPFVLEVDGSPWSGETVTLTVHGPSAAVAIALGTLSGTEFAIPWGFSLADPIALLQPLVVTFSETPAAIVMPDLSAFANVPFGLQALAVPLSNPALGVFTNLYRGVLDG